MKRVMILVFAILLFLVAGCQQNESKEEAAQPNDDTKYEDYVYTKYELDVKDKVINRGRKCREFLCISL